MALQERSTESYVKEYLHVKGPAIAQVHKVFAVESEFNESKSRYEAKDKLKDFIDTLTEFKRQEGHSLPFNPIQCSWSDVVLQLQKATLAAARSEQGDSHWFTSRVRKLANMTKTMEPLLEMIPDDLCYLHGALALIFHILQTREKARKEILDVFSDIPAVLSMAYSNSLFFTEDVDLQILIEELKMTLFDHIPRLIDILRPHSVWAKISMPFRSLKAEDLLAAIQTKCRKIETRARHLQGELAFDTHRYTESIYEISQTTQEHIGRINGQYRDIDNRIFNLQRTVDQQLRDALCGQNNMFQMLNEFVSVFFYQQQELATPTPQSLLPAPEVSSAEKRATLLALLEVWDGNEAQDLTTVLRQSQQYDSLSRSVGAMVLSSPQFQRWLASGDPDIIYVEGQLDSSRFGKTSPISYFCANLAEVFRMRESAIVLPFFCGQHVASNDRLNGPRGLIRSLLAQLLRAGSTNPLEELDFDSFQGTHEEIGTEELCRLFVLLLGGFPAHRTIFCIIDGFSHLEKEKWRRDYYCFLRALGGFLDASGSRTTLKVMVTSPTKSKILQESIRPESQIKVTDRGSRMGPGMQASLWDQTMRV